MKIKTATTILAAGLILSAAIGIMTISAPANAQSFSCAQAQIPSEHAVCNNESLIIKDERLASLFADALVAAARSDKLQFISAEHSLWLRERNECRNDFDCLEKRYDERILKLGDTVVQ